MKIGIVGLPLSGKTTLFKALAGSKAPQGRAETAIVDIALEDERLKHLAQVFEKHKVVFAHITFEDFPMPMGLTRGSWFDPQSLAQLRNMEALVHVVRAFSDPTIPHPRGSVEPLRDIMNFEEELCLNDLMVMEKRLSLLKKEARGMESLEAQVLQKNLPCVSEGKPLRAFSMNEAELRALSGYGFLSLMPQLVLLNTAEAEKIDLLEPSLQSYAQEHHLKLLQLCAKVEMELSQLSPDEQEEYREALGLGPSVRDLFIKTCFETLNLINFFTVGKDEVRAWSIPLGTQAQEASGKVHSDMEKGFIRAEVVSYEDFLASSSNMAKARQLGKLRAEGKTYSIQDGDIAHFLFKA